MAQVKEHWNRPQTGQRLLKELAYGNGITAADRSRGKLKTATRHNWVPSGTGTLDATVTETYTYGGKGGRVSARSTVDGPGHSFTQGWTYNDLGKVATESYPLCSSSPTFPCYTQAPAPARTVSFNYTKGLLSSVPGYAVSITYHSNAMLDALTFAPSPGNVTYALGVDLSGMKRIAYIEREGLNLQGTSTPYLDYYCDGAGQRRAHQRSEDYPRDLVGRVVEPATFTGGYKQTYAYDAVGNMTSKTTYAPRPGHEFPRPSP